MSSKAPITRQTSWPMVAPQLLSMLALMFFVQILFQPESILHSITIGASIYLLYSCGSRRLIARTHRKGIWLSKEGRFEEAIEQYEKSYAFFNKNSWIDRYRGVAMMTPSAISYREMALINIVYCLAQLGQAQQSKEYYEKTHEEFPNSGIAQSSLKMIQTFGSQKEGRNI